MINGIYQVRFTSLHDAGGGVAVIRDGSIVSFRQPCLKAIWSAAE